MLILRSSSFAVNLVAQALIGTEGGHVAVENPGNPMIWEVFQNVSAAKVHALPVDGDGLVVEALEDLMKTVKLNLLVVSPQCHFPTGAPLSAPRRKRVLELARQYRFAILEMDPEYDHLYRDPLPRPLASEDPTGQVLYMGSLSRLFAPGIRISYLTVPGALADRLAKVRQRMDWQGDPVLEWSLAELILDGEFLRHQRRVRKVSRERRTALLDAIHHTLTSRVEVTAEHSAMALWLRGVGAYADPSRFNAWVHSCIMKGLKLRPGRFYDFEGHERAATRLGFSAYEPDELQRAIALMGER
jgi:GntR family transcriptional regulator/MocR family aminotransferase